MDKNRLVFLKHTLDQAYNQYYNQAFIQDDPIQIPHSFVLKQDIEISAFIAAIFAWGQRKTIINKARAFINIMDNNPYRFIMDHKDRDLIPFETFCHRTFNGTDALFFIDLLKRIYREHESLEDIFFPEYKQYNVEKALTHFYNYAFSVDYAPIRCQRHLATPAKGSSCKRLNMFLRWMVRKDEHGVDFGLWNRIEASQLMIPLDVHVEKIARSFGMIERKSRDWKTVEELTNVLRILDPNDPVKYDYALFGIGVLQKKAII
jgi:uncharacterized protein (TIGR02757 family)